MELLDAQGGHRRWYSTEAGQWLSQDPLGYVDSFNSYAFNKFDPVNFVDPWGLATKNKETGEWETTVEGKREVGCDSACQDRAERQQQKMQERADDPNRNSGTRGGPAANQEKTSGELVRAKFVGRALLSMARSYVTPDPTAVRRWKVALEHTWLKLTWQEKMDPEEEAGIAVISALMGGGAGAQAGGRLGGAGGVGVLGLEQQLAQLMAARRAAALAAAAAGATVVLSQGGNDENPPQPAPHPAKPEKPPGATREVKVKDLDPLHSPEVSGARPELEKLTDKELLNSVNNPVNGDPLKVNGAGKLVDGNGRAYELQRRAAGPKSTIKPDTKINVQDYQSDRSMFPDLK